ncbi:MAG: molybdopterin-dependent oxidoreductase, partial [Oscillospiraceae bacterium]|nr:molybdopterin-dependent oxidoreductase [Oscillospiraceae bacterium]
LLTGPGRHHMAHFWRFSHVLGTPTASSSGPFVCLDPRVFSGRWTSGAYCSVDYYGKTKPKLILVWGSNPAVSGADGELQWFIKDAVKRGTRIIVVDPRPTELTAEAEMWLRVRPGTDGALAMGILHVILKEELYNHHFVENWCSGFQELEERCAEYAPERVSQITWIPKEQIIQAAHLIAGTHPASLEWGCAIEQGINSIQTCRALFILMGITGNYDVPGGFVESMEVAPTASHLQERLSEEVKAKCLDAGVPHSYRATMAHPRAIFEAIRDADPYKIRALLVHANNSLISMPDSKYVHSCLKEIEFMVYMDFFMTPTAELADIVLPAALWPEVDEVFAMPEFAEDAVLCMQKVVQVGECKSDEEVFFELSRRMGLDYGADSLEQIYDEQLAEMTRRRPELGRVNFEKFKKIGYIEPKRTYYNYLKRGGFPTSTGKFELYSNQVKEQGGDPLPFWQEVFDGPATTPHQMLRQYPLILTSGGRRHQYFISNNRQITTLRSQAPFPMVDMHPETAAKYGIHEGEWVWIATPKGRITQKAHFMPEMDPRVINCEMGWWYPEAGAPDYGWRESNVNVLTRGEPPYDELFGSWQFRGLICKISPNPDCKIEERYYNSKYYKKPGVDDSSNCIVLNPKKGILCGNCIETFRKVHSVYDLDIVTCEQDTRLVDRGVENMAASLCTGCGQCRANCPTGGIQIKSSVDQVIEALRDPGIFVVAQVAPSVRVGISNALGLPAGSNAVNLLTTAMRRAGFDRIHDTTFSADLPIVEEAAEFAAVLGSGENRPLFTSCCPAWVRFCESQFPDLAQYISTTRSPQQMMGAVLQEAYLKPGARRGKRAVFVSVMPCTAKKDECKRPESSTYGHQVVDYVLTTEEMIQLLDTLHIDLSTCMPGKPDAPYGTGSGGAVIFGVTGGVMEAALRYLMPTYDEQVRKQLAKSGVRGSEGIKEFDLEFQGKTLRIAVASGLGNARKLMERIRAGEHFDFVEVMACPGGCVMGGGQPANQYRKAKDWKERAGGLYIADERSRISRTNDNEEITAAAQNVICGRSHELLHRNFAARNAQI